MTIVYPLREIQEAALVSSLETICGNGVFGDESFSVEVVSGTVSTVSISSGKAIISGRFIENTAGWIETIGVSSGTVGVWLVFNEEESEPVLTVISESEPSQEHIALASIVMTEGKISEVHDVRSIIQSLFRLSKKEDTGWQELALSNLVEVPQSLASIALSANDATPRVRKKDGVVYLEVACQIQPSSITGLEGIAFGANSIQLTTLPDEFRPSKELVFPTGFYKSGAGGAPLTTDAFVAVKQDGKVMLYANNYVDVEMAALVKFNVKLNISYFAD